MRDRIRDIERLQHMLDAINVLLDNKDKHTYEELASDPIVFYGFVKHVEIIGEAVYMLTKDYRNQHREVEWDDIERMRHVLVHGYYKIRPIQLWDTIQTDIVELKPVIEKLIAEYE
ncbi:MAG: DUF86 domain-containing protein [Muribaculaceae bacterium]|nr:DUF86 domain-containing protein [Bacteroidales bacterium]MBR0492980.1 DUF86 domain-containing protein [Muribaculaceae bacterium]MBR3728615.1 DUF86 domain-containing protein [Muribaculaceae bacterium]